MKNLGGKRSEQEAEEEEELITFQGPSPLVITHYIAFSEP
jgi:hypothetical protein